MADSDNKRIVPRFTLTAEGAARIIILRYMQSIIGENEAVDLIVHCLDDAYREGFDKGLAEGKATKRVEEVHGSIGKEK